MDPTSMRSSFPGADLGDTFSSHLICCWMHDVIVSMILVGWIKISSWGGQSMENFFHHLKIIHIPIGIYIYYIYILIHENSN